MSEEGLLDRVPPHSEEAEMAVIGSAMIDREACTLLCGMLSRHDFYRGSHSKIWSVLRRLSEMGHHPDMILLMDWLKRLKHLDAIGGPAYLREISDAVPSSANCENYGRIVKEQALLRGVLSACAQGLEDVYRSDLEPAEVLFTALERLGELSHSKQEDTVELKTILRDIVDSYANKTFPKPMSTGLDELDSCLGGGLRKGEVTVIAGRPGMGKSSLAGAIAKNMADDGHKTLFVSLEMSGQSLAIRWLASALNVPMQVITMGTGVPEANVIAAAGELAAMDLSVSGAARVMEMKAVLMGAEVLVVDYLQLMDMPRSKDSMSDRIGEITRQLKRLAMTENVIVILLSQLNRDVEKRTDKRPMMADLRSSGNIEQDADNIALMYRSSYYDLSEAPDANGFVPVLLHIVKQRNGPTGAVESLRARLKTMTWETDDVY